MKKGKQKLGIIKLHIGAGKANPAPPIGPALGQRGVNIMEFCKQFNEATKNMEVGTPVPVLIDYYSDKSFTFITKVPPASYLIRKKAKLEKGAAAAGRDEPVGSITRADATEIALMKMKDMCVYDVEQALKSIIGTANSMGIEVVDA